MYEGPGLQIVGRMLAYYVQSPGFESQSCRKGGGGGAPKMTVVGIASASFCREGLRFIFMKEMQVS